MSTGIQPRGSYDSPRGLQFVKVLRPCKILSRHCNPGDIVSIEQTKGKIMPPEDGLTEALVDQLVSLRYAKIHQLQPGDQPFSVQPKIPKPYADEIESATDPAPRQAERAVMPRQKSGGAV